MKANESDKVIKELGQKLKKTREKLKLTQAYVAAKTGMDVTYYARIERGEVNTSFKKLYKIFEVLRLEIV